MHYYYLVFQSPQVLNYNNKTFMVSFIEEKLYL